MSRPVTARRAAHHGVPKDAMTQSPYTGAWVEVAGARMCGAHVEFMRPDGRWFVVDARHPVFRVKP